MTDTGSNRSLKSGACGVQSDIRCGAARKCTGNTDKLEIG